MKEGDNILILGDEDKGIALVNLGSVSGNIPQKNSEEK